MSASKPYQNVFEALEDDPGMAESLRLRSEMMMQLRGHIENQGITREEASYCMGVTQPRINDLLNGKIEQFTIDTLFNMLTRIGIQMELILKQAA